ncbi:replication initiation protein [Haematobacter massiliensis]|uniref:replication initiation protein n=1 Tax=Haematobacter massiliensis TaxID=195105 RepID=UPI0023F581DD|nr:replication initiation protein [Haematobacter massiliensis]
MTDDDEIDLQGVVWELSSHAPQHPDGSRWVSTSNALTRAGHGLSLSEKRLVFLAIARMNSSRDLPEKVSLRSRVSAAEYAEAFDVESHTAYEALRDAASHLFERKISFYQPAFTRKGKPLKPTLVNMRWVGEVHYQDGEGYVDLYWWPRLMPHLTGLKQQFTRYQLQQASALRSAYSWKLLELLTSYEDSGRIEIDIDDFATAMGATDKQRENFAQVRRKIIEPAVAELIEKDGWLIDWHPVKAGRRVAAVRFTFRRDPQGRLGI